MAVDSYWSSVTAFLPCDGSVVSDVSGATKTVKLGGSAALSATASISGGKSLYIPKGSYVDLAPHADFAMPGDFTIELFVRRAASGDNYPCLLSTYTSGSAPDFGLLAFDTGAVQVFYPGSYVNTAIGLLAADTWTHLALVRSGTTLKLYIAGTLAASATSSAILGRTDIPFRFGNIDALSTAHRFAGYIDEVRVTNGVARYNTPFTPPASAFLRGYYVAGNTFDSIGNVAQMPLRLYRRSDNVFVDAVVSAADGSFSVWAKDSSEHYILAFPSNENGLIVDHITPSSS